MKEKIINVFVNACLTTSDSGVTLEMEMAACCFSVFFCLSFYDCVSIL